MQNQIIIGDNQPGTVGNCYIGAIANKAIFDKEMQHSLDCCREILKRQESNKAWCYEYMNGEFILRAAQATVEGAEYYMNENSVLVKGE